MEFHSLEQRMIHARQCLLAPFHASATITEDSQRDFYDYISELLQRFYDEPTLMFPTLTEDDAHPNRFNCSSYGKPELRQRMRVIDKKLDALFDGLAELGRDGVPEEAGLRLAETPGRKTLNLLRSLGLRCDGNLIVCDTHPRFAEAWHGLAVAAEGRSYVLARCWFDESYPNLQETYRRLYDESAYRTLTDWLNANGYRQYSGFNRSECLDYAKCVKPEDVKLGLALHGDPNHYGFTFEYRAEATVPQHCLPRLIQFAKLLSHMDELSADSRSLIMERTKHCDGCRYCVQTDKSGKRSLAAIAVPSGEKLCPYYPGFSFTRTALTDDDARRIIALLTDLERVLGLAK